MTTTNLQTACIVIPTRNRATLAMNAINSALADSESAIQVLVSDNSTEIEEVELLRNFCTKRNDERLEYIRPPQSLPMRDHWEWVLEQALANPSISHVLYLTDRMVLKRGELKKVLLAAASFPADVISYGRDGVYDLTSPIRLSQPSWTGNLYRIPTIELLRLSSDLVFHYSLPCMLNCIVPRGIFDIVKERYGNVFDSIAPDFTFAFRCLERQESVLHLDRTVLVDYALKRSNGTSQGRGVPNKDHIDFLANLPEKGLSFAAPVPAFRTVGNALVHEYCLVREQTHSEKFPPVNLNRYYKIIESEIGIISDPKLHQEMVELLHAQPYDPAQHRQEQIEKFRRSMFSLKFWRVKFWWIATTPRLQPMWDFLRRHAKIQVPGVREILTELPSAEDALIFASEHPRRHNTGPSYLETLIKTEKLKY